MIVKFIDLKMAIDKASVYLPYNFVLKSLISSGKIEKLSNARVTSESKFKYIGNDLNGDIVSTRKPYYVVAVTNYNMPTEWLSFNETIFDLAMQAKDEISFYFPYYDLSAVKYFSDFADIKTKKHITLYPPWSGKYVEEANKAVTEFKKLGFTCTFSKTGNHEKAYIFDKKAAIIGSFNFTGRAIYRNNELGVLFFGSEVATLEKFLERKNTD